MGGCYMGYFDPVTGEEFEGPPAPAATGDDGGLTTEGANVITSAIDALSDIGTGLINYFGQQNAPGAAPVVTPGAGVVLPQAPARAGMDPVMLAAIGIPAALIAVALMGKKR